MDIVLKNSVLVVLFFLNLFLFFSCSEENNTETEVETVVNEIPLDTFYCRSYAENLLVFLQKEYSVSFVNKIQLETFFDKNSNDNLNSENDSLLNELKKHHFNLYTEFNEVINFGGRIDFVKSIPSDSNFNLLFRGYIPPMEITFWEITLGGTKNKVLVEDILSYQYEKSHKAMFDDIIDKSSNDSDTELLNSFLHLDSSYNYLRSNQIEKAWNQLLSLKPSLQYSPLYKYSKFRVSTYISEELRQEVLKEWLKDMEKGTAAYWLYYFYYSATNEELGQARIALMNLKETVGSDPILHYLEGVTYFEEFKYEQALSFYTEALAAMPTVPDIHFAKVVCLIEMKEYVQAVESLLVMDDYFDISNINWDKEFIGYPEFLVSDEFDRLLERVEDPV